ncbi:DUF3971 domain-containing protein [Arsenophonus symbiont of Ornithomya chloropus]|uniref:YhdP family protein n=1 Tax=Arsenophonus symbiont of Ornithomya chloropus TaxID=634121 RepID=UPI0032B2A3D4
MKQLIKLLVSKINVIILIFFLFFIASRFFILQMNLYKNQFEENIYLLTGIPLKIRDFKVKLNFLQPNFVLSDVVLSSEKINIQIKKITFVLDIWRLLFSFDLFFHEIVLYQLNFDYYKPLNLISKADFDYFKLDIFSNIIFKKIYSLILKDSYINFLSPLLEKKTLNIPKFICLNQNDHYLAEGIMNFDIFKKKSDQNIIQIKINFCHKNNINKGMVYLHGNKINLSSFLNCWIDSKINLENLVFGFSSWIVIKNSRIEDGQIYFDNGSANWNLNAQKHEISFRNLYLNMKHQENHWFFCIPQLENLITDEKKWLEGQASFVYFPKLKIHQDQDHWQILLNNVALEQLRSFFTIFSCFMPDFIKNLEKYQIKGKLVRLVLDITPKYPEKTLIDITWNDMNLVDIKNISAINHFSGSFKGGYLGGIFVFNLNNSKIKYKSIFKTPVNISSGHGTIFWSRKNKLDLILGKNINLQVKSLWINGDFRYFVENKNKSMLSLLAGAKLKNVGDLWHYFPQPFIGKKLNDYLKKTIISGYVDEASLLFHGDPHNFSFKENNGEFQIFIPLRSVIFQYQHNWPKILNLNIDLNFERNRLDISSKKIKLGNIEILDISGYITNYGHSKLLIRSKFNSDAEALRDYLMYTPIKNIIKILNVVKIHGKFTGQLMLSIPLAEYFNTFIISGRIGFNKNNIHIFDKKIKKLTGYIYFKNSNFESKKLCAEWFGQPVNLTLKTMKTSKNYYININFSSHWQADKIFILPRFIKRYLSGITTSYGKVSINIPL